MNKYMPFSPVEIIFSSHEDAIKYIHELTSGDRNTLLLASHGRIKELGLENRLIDAEECSNIFQIRKIPSNPTIIDIYENLKLLQGKSINQIIAIGGGELYRSRKSN